jgi:hypothetical protein
LSALQSLKLYLAEMSYLSKDSLHVYVGLIVFFGSALVFKWSLRGWKPIASVAAAALAGELWDIVDRANDGVAQNLPANWHDIWNTLFWPVVIAVLLTRTRIFAR